ncbi:dual specificity protein phosphatase family protein [Novipirellula artificiosorum]|uniref:Dual specificity phosphatase, catalytic domain n=1 Tax=Novipirellula artificiosorum TaxID=2528016 RepID=A0A5C6E3Y3_9BACT|nr:dual specificity protein phosphatase family protein [Novipirellula artificiosorum]TWU41919.1 hypothetical protein Poly41_02120 [Novipirellula artificiosorum]
MCEQDPSQEPSDQAPAIDDGIPTNASAPAAVIAEIVPAVQPTRTQKLYAKAVFYPTLAWNYTLGRILGVRRWWDYIDAHVIVGAYPFAGDVPGLAAEGVKAVVNTCEEYPGPLAAYEAFGISQFWMPTTDFTHPSLENVKLAVEFVEEHTHVDETVYIHCKAGRARSATVALCWLMKYRGLSIEQAQEKLLLARPHINPHLGDRPVVKQFAQQLAQESNGR